VITFHWLYLFVFGLTAFTVFMNHAVLSINSENPGNDVFIALLDIIILMLGVGAAFTTHYLIGRYGW
jgi:hypothetical protein